jgi:prepilin-type N-terminal cleavage/methylation domain-containing protein
MLTGPMAPRRGLTLIEILITLVIVGVIGLAITRVITSQGRLYSQQTGVRDARSTARTAMGVMMNELRMVQDSAGVDSVATNGRLIRFRVPYRLGLLCGNAAGGVATVAMLPTDSATLAMATYAGWAWRDPVSGRYTIQQPAAPTGGDAPVGVAAPALCTGSGAGQANLRPVTVAGRSTAYFTVTPPLPGTPVSGSPVFFWQRVTYRFAPSTAFPGRTGLYRDVQGGTSEELMAPFDQAAHFRFYRAGDDTSIVTPPALAQIRGIDVVLSAEAPRRVSGQTANNRAALRTAIFFKNTRTF